MARKNKWDKHTIIAAIHRSGTTLTALEKQSGLNAGDCSVALVRRFPKAEEIISAFLDVELHQLWPDRYDETGCPIRYIRKKQNEPLTRAAQNRINQALARRARMQEVA